MREGYFRIEFYKMDGTADADGAKRVFDYCAENENYSDWFTGDFINPRDGDSETDTMFTLDGNRWVQNLNAETEDRALDGTPLNLGDWLLPACREAKAERVIASAMISGATLSRDDWWYWDDCWYEEVLYENGAEVHDYVLPYFNLSWAPELFLFKKVGGGVRVHVKAREEFENSFRPLRGVFRSKKTGEKVLGGYIVHYKDDGDHVCDYFSEGLTLTFEIGRVKAALSDDDDGLSDEDKEVLSDDDDGLSDEDKEVLLELFRSEEFARLYDDDNDADEGDDDTPASNSALRLRFLSDDDAEVVREFVRLYNYDNDADEDAADWTFEGFDCEKDFFALYGAQGEEDYKCVFGDEEDYVDYSTDLEEYDPLEDDE